MEDRGGKVYAVQSQSNENIYIVNLEEFSCECTFYHENLFCKHVFACERLAGDTSDAETEIQDENDHSILPDNTSPNSQPHVSPPLEQIPHLVRGDHSQQKIARMIEVLQHYQTKDLTPEEVSR